MLLNATPMMTATAKSTTLPRSRNVLKPFITTSRIGRHSLVRLQKTVLARRALAA
jgi:hypothetical protein